MKMNSLLSHFKFKNDFSDSTGKNYDIVGNPKTDISNETGCIFECGDAINIPPVILKGDYTITSWFKTPLPGAIDFNSLCSDGWNSKAGVPALIRKNDGHLGIFNETDFFIDSGFSINTLSVGEHHLTVIADSILSQTLFYVDNTLVGKSKSKINSVISQVGNNGNAKNGFEQPFGYLRDFRIYNKKLNFSERQNIINETNFSQNINPEFSIEFKNISKSFKFHHEKQKSLYEFLTTISNKKSQFTKLQVLDNVDFKVNKGEMLGIIGYNGSGKSTILKLIAKIYSPDRGTIKSTGKIIPLLELGAGFNPEFTARENIILYGLFLGFTKKEIKSRIEKIIKFAELENFLDTKIKNFSTGMYARLAFSVSLEVDPDILLVDEVLSVGDIQFQEKSFKEFIKFKKKGKTIIFVSHSSEATIQYCDKVLWVHEGKIQEYGVPKLVLESYLDNSFS